MELVIKGKLRYCESDILQSEWEPTVYRGWFEGTPVAIKRIQKSVREVSLKQHGEFDRHENIARYYATEEDDDYYYVGVELWDATLEQLVMQNYPAPFERDKEILLQIAKAVDYLSGRGLVNRNINPRTIMVVQNNGIDPARIKLTDFSASWRFGQDEPAAPESCWTAPELLRRRLATCDAKVDVFSTGCVFAYVLSGAGHPYNFQTINILAGAVSIPPAITDRTAVDLIINMLKFDPSERFTIKQVLAHPYFWDAEKCLKFIDAIVAMIEPELRSGGPLYSALESAKPFNGQWTDQLTENVRDNIINGRAPMRRPAERSSFYHLLKALRNKWKHFDDVGDPARQEYGQSLEDYYNYWTSRFPGMLIDTWNAMKVHDPPTLRRFFDPL